MKRLKLKKAGTLFVLMVFLFTSVLSMAGLKIEALAAEDFILTHTYTNTLYPNSEFEPIFKMTNLTSDDIHVKILDFSVSGIVVPTHNNSPVFPVDQPVPAGASNFDIGSYRLKYIGDGTTSVLPVRVTYKVGTGDYVTETVNLYLNVDRPSTPPQQDYSQYKPNITASVPESLALSAGKKANVTVTLKNLSNTVYAKDIVFNPKYESGSPFISVKPVTEMPINQLGLNSSTQLTFSVEVDKFASEGLHPFSFELSYKNPWNDDQSTICTVYIRVINYLTNCNLLILPPESLSAKAGEAFNLPLTLKNDGNLSAKDVRIEITNLSQDTFTLVSGTGRNDIARLYGNETKNLTYSLRTSSSLKSGSYPLTFSMEYVDESGAKITDQQTIWIPVSGSGEKGSALEILEITPSKTTVNPEDIIDVTVKVKNSGANDSGQVKISADGTNAMLPVSQNLHIIQSIKKGETRVISFKFQPHPDAQKGSVPITIRVEPMDGGDGAAISQAIAVFVDSDTTGEADPNKSIPKLIIKSYSSDPTLVNAGERFNLTMQFLNTHSTKEVRNIKGSFSVSEGSSESGNVFTPVGSSNTFYIDRISPQNTAEWNVTLYTIPDAKSKTYTVTISFEYEDELGVSHTASEIIGIPVYQPSRFEVSEISLPPDTFIGQPLYTMFEMYNLGKTEIYNVKLRVEGDFDAQPKSNYFGNFESGRVEYFELNLIPMTAGQATGRIIFQYEDASGEVHEVVKEFSMNVMEMMMPPDDGFPVDGPIGKPGYPGMEEQPAKSFFKSIWFYVIIGAVVVVIVVVIILIARKRKKKEFDF